MLLESEGPAKTKIKSSASEEVSVLVEVRSAGPRALGLQRARGRPKLPGPGTSPRATRWSFSHENDPQLVQLRMVKRPSGAYRIQLYRNFLCIFTGKRTERSVSHRKCADCFHGFKTSTALHCGRDTVMNMVCVLVPQKHERELIRGN